MRRLLPLLVWLSACAAEGLPPAPDAGVASCLAPAWSGLPALDCAGAPRTIDVASLLDEMIDLDRLTRRRCDRFTTLEASSRDPRSVAREPPTDSDSGWFANVDWGNYLRVETHQGRTEYVMLDVDGPGALVRMWTANGPGVTLRIYLDGQPDPVLTADFARLLSGEVPPFAPPFAVVNSIGMNFDFPIPFRRHFKATLEGDAAIYFYQLFYRRYEAGADVTTFTLDQLAQPRMDEVARVMTGGPAIPTDGVVREDVGGPGVAQIALSAAPGGSEITRLEITSSSHSAAALRESVLSMTFDGEETVRVPLGDFFGGGPGFHPHRTLPVEVTGGGAFISRFIMPFASCAVIRVEGDPGRRFKLGVRHRPSAFTDGRYHLHAHWTARGPLATRPLRDLTLASVESEGVYAGTVLSLDGDSSQWWGEGDEKVWVDHGAAPAWFGTGTEDYFGYAYSSRDPYDHAYRLLDTTGEQRAQIASARFHVLDAIPFRAALEFDLELWAWDVEETIFFDTLSTYYAAPGATSPLPPPAPAEFRLP